MKRIVTIVLAALAVIVLAAMVRRSVDREPPAADDELSAVALGLLEGSGAWAHLGARNVLVHAQTRDVLADAAREADFTFAYVQRMLGRPVSPGARAHLFLVSDSNLWERVLLEAGVRREGLAVQVENEVFVLREPDAPLERLQIPHEMVHLCLARTYGRGLPLWLEEGLAGYLGWEAARANGAAQGRELKRTMPGLAADTLLSIDALTAVVAYPDDEEALKAFYRQSQDLVWAIARRTGEQGLPELVRVVAETQRGWRDVLRHHFHCTSGDLRAIQGQALARSAQTVVD